MSSMHFTIYELIEFHAHLNWAWFLLTIKAPITTAADDKFRNIFPNIQINKEWYFMRIVCQTIRMKYHALFVIFEKKNSKIWNCRLL